MLDQRSQLVNGYRLLQSHVEGQGFSQVLCSIYLVFFFVGEQAIFICNVSSGSSSVTNVSLVEVTEVNSESSTLDKHQQKFLDNSILSSYHQVSFSITNLQIPEGRKIQVRQFICEVKYRDHTFRSELADLIILPPSPEQLDPSTVCLFSYLSICLFIYLLIYFCELIFNQSLFPFKALRQFFRQILETFDDLNVILWLRNGKKLLPKGIFSQFLALSF